MRSFLFLFFLLILASCENSKKLKFDENKDKQKKILMKITTESNVKIKK